MDTKILPFLVMELTQLPFLFECELCMSLKIQRGKCQANLIAPSNNRLQTDEKMKVSPDQMEEFWVLDWQAQNIVNLYPSQMKEFNKYVDQWESEQRQSAISSRADSFTSGIGYELIKAMGKSAVPLIMDRYAEDQDGW